MSIILSGASTLPISGTYSYKISLHHHAGHAANPDNKPVTLRTSYIFDLTDSHGYALTHHTKNGPERIAEDDICRWPGPPDADATVIVDKNHGFISLAPGESHIIDPIHFYPNHFFLEDFQVGEKYSFQYTGDVISWWDWGTLEVSQITFHLYSSNFILHKISLFMSLIRY